MGPGKAKQFLIVCVKLLVIAAASYFIWRRLAAGDAPDWPFVITRLHSFGFPGIITLLLLSFFNRFFEILKWQNLVSSFRNISVGESTRQVLSSMTLSVFTPAGIGEYAGKALFFEKAATEKIIFLNLVCNGAQMLVSLIFGIWGLLYFNSGYHLASALTVIIILLSSFALTLLIFFLKKFSIKGWSLERLNQKIRALPLNVHRKNTILALARYLIFSHQYYLLFLCFGADVPYLTLMAGITSIYLLSSLIPTFQFMDFAVKGGVAIFFLGLAGVNGWIVMHVTTLMWLLNVVIPVAIGSWFIVGFKWRTA